jgi:DNA invertase Pin-like site-specific DNA recombinase
MGNVFAYTRVSTVKQGEKGVSLQEQKDAILRYARQHNLEITRWFEEQETASKQGRLAFTHMLKLLRLKVAEGVIIHKIDRSARNLGDWVDVGKLADAGVAIHFANESVDLGTVSGRLSADIQAVVAAHYSRNLREETKKGFYGRLKQGFYPIRAPIGYLDQGSAKPKLPDPAMAPLVRESFDLYGTGKFSLLELVGHMYKRGLRNRSGGSVTLNGISTILNNPFYVGIMRIKRTGQNFSGNHAPLVNRELFDRVQALLRGKTVDRVVKHSFLFSRLVRCASCHYSLIAERKKGHTYYRCHNRPFKIPPVCPKTAIREEQLEDAVLRILEALTLSDAEVNLLHAWIADHRQHAAAEREEVKRTSVLQLEALHARVSRLTDFLLDGSVEKTVFEEKQKALVWEEVQLKQNLAALEAGRDDTLKEIERTVELAKDASLLYKQANEEQKRELLRILLSNLTASGKNISVELQIPFRLISERGKTSHGSPNRGTCRTLGNILEQIHRYITKTSTGLDART